MGETTPHALARNRLADSLLKRQISVAGRSIPVWLFGAGALLSVLGIATLIVIGSLLFGGKREAATIKDDASNSAVAKDSELSQLIARARLGDQTALAELEARPEPMRGENEWLALGRGYATLQRLSTSLSAYQKGVLAKPELGRDPKLLADVRRAALDAQTSEAALEIRSQRARRERCRLAVRRLGLFQGRPEPRRAQQACPQPTSTTRRYGPKHRPR